MLIRRKKTVFFNATEKSRRFCRLVFAVTLTLLAQGQAQAQEPGRGLAFNELRNQTSSLPTSSKTELPISLKRDIEILSEFVRLSDIFDGLSLERDTLIARAPELGKRVVLTAQWLNALAKRHGVNWRTKSRLDQATIRRASVTLRALDLQQEITSFMREQKASKDIEVRLDRRLRDIVVPAEIDPTLDLSLRQLNADSGRFALQLSIMGTDNKPHLTRALSGKVLDLTSVPVISRSFKAGEIITEGDLEWKNVAIRDLSPSHLTQLATMVGKTTRRPMKAGRLLTGNDVETPKAVNKNEIVTMKATSDFLRLSATGRALENGAVGESIRIMNTQTSQVVTGVIQEDGSITVAMTAETL